MNDNPRAEILDRIRRLLAAAPPPTPPTTPAWPPLPRTPPPAALIDLFCERARDYRAGVTSAPADRVAHAVASIAARHHARRLIIPPGLPDHWRPPQLDLTEDDGNLRARQLEQFDGALTAAGAAIAETGTIALDHGPGQGRRSLTLLPDLHICIVPTARLAADIPDALAALDPIVRGAHRPLTLISGPSATSDIELRRVEGVHGPRNLEIVITDDRY
jgi:L-lactate dehydrogenase complex protein LldG